MNEKKRVKSQVQFYLFSAYTLIFDSINEKYAEKRIELKIDFLKNNFIFIFSSINFSRSFKIQYPNKFFCLNLKNIHHFFSI